MKLRTPIQRGVITLRQALHLTQDQFADLMGVSPSSVQKWETKSSPHAKSLTMLRNEAAKLKREDLVQIFMIELMHRRGSLQL